MWKKFVLPMHIHGPSPNGICVLFGGLCFPVRNDLDRISVVPGITLGHSRELTLGYKPRYRLEVLFFHFRQEMAVWSRYNTSYPEMEVPGISSASL